MRSDQYNGGIERSRQRHAHEDRESLRALVRALARSAAVEDHGRLSHPHDESDSHA